MKINDKLLRQALANNNDRFMNSLDIEIFDHDFSAGFERKMKHLISANKNYGGRLWLEKGVRYIATIAAVILCFVSINFITIKAFNLNLWTMAMSATEHYINITFNGQPTETSTVSSEKLQIVNIPEGYDIPYGMGEEKEDLFIQTFVSDRGSITYTETSISENMEIDVEKGDSTQEVVADRIVTFINQEGSIVAVFNDDSYSHVISVQGEDANVEFVRNIIEEMEDR